VKKGRLCGKCALQKSCGTPSEAGELGKLIEAYVKALEATDFAERLTKLERMTLGEEICWDRIRLEL
jgi:hypothetical protein